MPLPSSSPSPSLHEDESSSQPCYGKAINTGRACSAPSPSDLLASTVQSSDLPTLENHAALRARSSTRPDRHVSASFSTRPRASTTSQSTKPPLQIQLPSTTVRLASASCSPEALPTVVESPAERPSAPIDIPARKKPQGQHSRPTTPLTARAPQGEYFASWFKAEPGFSESLIPYYSSRAKKPPDSQEPSAAQRNFSQNISTSHSTQYRPSSPLSPKVSAPLPSISNRQKAKLPTHGLNPAALPKYHPAKYSPNPASSSPSRSRSITSQPRSGRVSGAKQQLLQYQRDLLHTTAKTSHSLLSSSISSKPTPPRLNPLMSPGEPMTPLMLEGASDYLAAGSGFLPAGSEESDGREFVERLIRRENERRNHPEARAGSVSPALSLSPAVSPAGGRG